MAPTLSADGLGRKLLMLTLSILLGACTSAQKVSALSSAAQDQPASLAKVECDGIGDNEAMSCLAAGFQVSLSRCWKADALWDAPNPESLALQIEFELDPTGRLVGVPRVLDAGRGHDPYVAKAQKLAVEAVIACQPYGFLPLDRHDLWKEMHINFVPSQMAGF